MKFRQLFQAARAGAAEGSVGGETGEGGRAAEGPREGAGVGAEAVEDDPNQNPDPDPDPDPRSGSQESRRGELVDGPQG